MPELPLGVVLVGGRSRRMGEDKALLHFHGQPLAVHVAHCLSRVCPRVVLVGGGGRRYEQLGWPWWPDPPGIEGHGPLVGLVAALLRAPDLLLVGCDQPHLEPRLLRRLLAAAGPAPVAIPVLDGRPQPLVARYRRAALPMALKSIACRSRRMSDLLLVPGARPIPAEALGTRDEVVRALSGVNEPGDLAAARLVAAPPEPL